MPSEAHQTFAGRSCCFTGNAIRSHESRLEDWEASTQCGLRRLFLRRKQAGTQFMNRQVIRFSSFAAAESKRRRIRVVGLRFYAFPLTIEPVASANGRLTEVVRALHVVNLNLHLSLKWRSPFASRVRQCR